MLRLWSRRALLKLSSITISAGGFALGSRILAAVPPDTRNPSNQDPIPDLFPTQPPELVREMVTVSHFSLERVKALVEPRPSLARASWDWGFGDWETALGAASHMGNRPIAEYLISMGARPSLFSAAMLGQSEVVKAFVAAQPGVQRIRGPHSISLLAHAKAGGESARPVFDFLQSLGDADSDPPAPLTEADVKSLKGLYIFGSGASQQIEVTIDRGQVNWVRKGMAPRPLFHLGGRVFHPPGAPSVRIRFTQDDTTTLMTVNDPDVVLSIRRKQESN